MAAVTAPCGISPVRRTRPGQVAQTRRPAPTRPLSLTKRGRVVLGLGVIVALVLAVLASAALLLGPGATPAAASGDKTVHAKATIVTVRSGETLWSIANRVAPAADPRETVMALQELNNLASPTVYVGERLIIPMAR